MFEEKNSNEALHFTKHIFSLAEEKRVRLSLLLFSGKMLLKIKKKANFTRDVSNISR